MDGTILSQGSFVVPAAGPVAVNLSIPSNVDWMRVFNYTQAGINGAANTGINFYWQRGMPVGGGIVQYKTAAGVALLSEDTYVSSGFTLLDSSVVTPAAAIALTAITAANPPVVTTASTAGIAVGSIVRLSNLDNQPQIGGIDFTVTAVTLNTNFTIGNINLTNSVASTAGNWRLIPFDPIFYPRDRVITYISSTNPAKVYMSVTHNFAVGQKIRLSFPGGSFVWGQFAVLDGRQFNIIAVNAARAGNEPNNAGTANNIVIDLDASGFPAWNTFGVLPNANASNQGFPPAAGVPFTPAQVAPVGEDSATSLSSVLAQVPLDFNGLQVPNTQVGLLSDAEVNTALVGMTLGIGGNGTALGARIVGPAGSAAADVMFWLAGKSSMGGL